MTSEEAILRLSQLFNGATSKTDASYTVIQLVENYDNRNNSEIVSSLKAIGYKNAEDSIDGNEVWLNRTASCWDTPILYEDLESFWVRIHTQDNIPDVFIIGSPLVFPTASNDSLDKFRNYFTWKNLLCIIADHYNSDCSVLFFINEGKSRKIELKHSLSFKDICSLSEPSRKLAVISELLETISINDLHKSERKLVIRSAINEMSKSSKISTLIELIDSTEIVREKYDELYEVYTKRFSVNKILNELDEKNLEFTSKINEFISSNQSKALTIPGALIAAGGLVKANETVEAILIVVGLWMIKKVNFISVDVFNETFDNLTSRVESAFDKYLNFEDNKEIINNAESIKASILTLIKKAKSRMKAIKNLASIMFYGGLAYVSYKQYPFLENVFNTIFTIISSVIFKNA